MVDRRMRQPHKNSWWLYASIKYQVSSPPLGDERIIGLLSQNPVVNVYSKPGIYNSLRRLLLGYRGFPVVLYGIRTTTPTALSYWSPDLEG